MHITFVQDHIRTSYTNKLGHYTYARKSPKKVEKELVERPPLYIRYNLFMVEVSRANGYGQASRQVVVAGWVNVVEIKKN